MLKNEAYRTEALRVINEYWAENCRPPTYREVKDLAGLKSTSTTSRVMRELQEMGEIVLGGKGKSRSPIPLWVKKAIEEARPETWGDYIVRYHDGVWKDLQANDYQR